ncbi:MAG: WG repeat-containing protein, partial [Prevotellaceae bacterium]|nr:WG repeat-containing protein [Prevotellaceae bacterium]
MKKILLMAFMLINIQSYAQHKKYDNTPNFSKGRAHVTLNGKWGVIDETGKEVIPVKYDALEYFYGNSSMAKASLNGKWGFIDKLGNEIIPIKYDWIGNFWRSLAMVSLDGKWGLVDNTGREVTPVKYAKLGVFSEGLAPVSLNGKWGFIDETGEEVIPIKYDDFERFTDGIAKVSISGKWGTIDKYGTEKGFSETLAKNQEEQPSNVTLADSYAQNAPTFVKYLIGKATYRQEDRCYYVEVPNSVKLNLKELIKSFAELENLSLANYATSTEIVNGRTFVFNGKTRSNVYKYDYVTAFTFRKINWKLDGPDAGLLLKDKKNTIEKSVQAALEAGKFENAYYVAYYQGIEKSKVAKWLKKHSQLVVIKDDDTRFQFTTSREEAISYVDKKRKFEADVAYKKKLFADVNEKVFKKNGSWFYTLELDNVDLAIETKEKYPDFILNLDRLGLTAS